jgi:tripartite-type tricarboxylate transporter receptor subunit TctC
MEETVIALRFFALCGIMAVVPEPTPAHASDQFYGGKTIAVVIPSGASGGYDSYARLLARHMGKHVPGQPRLVVHNMPGGAGVRAADYLTSVAPQDGTAIGMLEQALYLRQVLELPGLRGDVRKYNWIGRLVSNSAVLYAWHTAKVQRINDAFSNELIVSAAGTAPRLNWTALNMFAGTKLRMITGYEGPSAAKIAMERGEVEATAQPWPVIRRENAEWLRDKKINLLVQTGDYNQGLEHLPRMTDLAKTEENRKVLEIFAAPAFIGRSIFTSPNVAADRVKVLRRAFDLMLKDDEFLSEANKINLDIEPVTGLELQTYFANVAFAPPLVVRAKEVAERAGLK